MNVVFSLLLLLLSVLLHSLFWAFNCLIGIRYLFLCWIVNCYLFALYQCDSTTIMFFCKCRNKFISGVETARHENKQFIDKICRYVFLNMICIFIYISLHHHHHHHVVFLNQCIFLSFFQSLEKPFAAFYLTCTCELFYFLFLCSFISECANKFSLKAT